MPFPVSAAASGLFGTPYGTSVHILSRTLRALRDPPVHTSSPVTFHVNGQVIRYGYGPLRDWDQAPRGRLREGDGTISSLTADAQCLHDQNVRLMLRVQNGDDDAFAQLVTQFQKPLVNRFFRQLDDWHMAEDLAQEVFLRVYRARRSYRPTARFSTWLFTIANHLVANARRHRCRHPEVSLPTCQSDSERNPANLVDDSVPTPIHQLEDGETRAIVHSAIDSLRQRQQAALKLACFDRMSYTAIGDVLDTTPVGAKGLLARARQTLRWKLEPYIQRGLAVM